MGAEQVVHELDRALAALQTATRSVSNCEAQLRDARAEQRQVEEEALVALRALLRMGAVDDALIHELYWMKGALKPKQLTEALGLRAAELRERAGRFASSEPCSSCGAIAIVEYESRAARDAGTCVGRRMCETCDASARQAEDEERARTAHKDDEFMRRRRAQLRGRTRR
ncbi:MAG: hypothetical protein QOD92_451 [Acidimicrobiaceae bacterium]|jgi:hypothetical protein